MTNAPPPGFRLLPDLDAVLAHFAPIHCRRDGQHLTLGFLVGPQHANPRGTCHGGCWATVADVQLGLNVGTMTGSSGPTVSLALDFLGPARIGQWVEGTTRLLRQTPKLAFVDGTFTADGELVLRVNGIFRLKGPPFRDFESTFGGIRSDTGPD